MTRPIHACFTSCVLAVLLLAMSSCSMTTYSVRSKYNKQFEKPSVALIEKIVAYREKYNEWPPSKEALVSRDIAYRDAFDGFPYLYTKFKVNSIDEMVFYFDQHIRDVKNYEATKKVDLNTYRGEVKFYRSGEHFLWKIKMY